MSKLSLHHIGGRGGSKGFPCLSAFEADLINVIYDADAACIEQIKQAYSSQPQSTTHVLPYCIGEKSSTSKFFITYDTYNSSLLPLNEEFADFSLFYVSYECLMSDIMKPMETIPVKLVTLDQLYREGKTGVPAPDFLSLDVEGYEYPILKGASRLLDDCILGVIAEVAFSPLRKNQKLFSDIMKLMQAKDFYFVKFTSMHDDYSPCRKPIGLRAEGFQCSADALFLKKIKKGRKNRGIGSNQKRPEMLAKLAFISMVFNQFEYGLMCLDILEKEGSRLDGIEQNAYTRFLSEVYDAAKKTESFYPPKFSSVYTFQQSKDRFKPQVTSWGPGRYFEKDYLAARADKFAFNDLENILLKYGFNGLAHMLRSNRIYHTFNTLYCAGYMDEKTLNILEAKQKYMRDNK